MTVNWDAVAAIADVIAAAGVVVTLAYLATQVRQGTAQSKRVFHRATVNELGRTLQSLASSADLASVYVRGLRDYDGLTIENKARFSAFMMHLFKLFEELWRVHMSGELDLVDWRGYEAAITGIASYPGVKSWWETRTGWVHPEFEELVRSKARDSSKGIYNDPFEPRRSPADDSAA
jgi:hypothetical protein